MFSLVYFPYFEKKKVGLWDHQAVRARACVCVSPRINFWMAEPIFMKLGMYIMAHKPISTMYFINPSHQSVCLYVYPTIVARQRLGKHIPAATNTRNIKKLVGRIVFCAVRVLSKETVCLCVLSLPGNDSVNTFPWQRIHITITVLLDASFSVRYVSYKMRLTDWQTPCGGGVEYLHRDPASRRRRRKGIPVPWGTYNCVTLFLVVRNTGTWHSR
jgi:hypothetical protein